MFKKKIAVYPFLICLLIVFTVRGQENSVWFSYALGGDKTKITELKDVIKKWSDKGEGIGCKELSLQKNPSHESNPSDT